MAISICLFVSLYLPLPASLSPSLSICVDNTVALIIDSLKYTLPVQYSACMHVSKKSTIRHDIPYVECSSSIVHACAC